MSKKHLYQTLKDSNLLEVNSGWRKFKLLFIKNLHYDDDKCDGAVDFDKCEIYLDTALDHERARETLMHEIMHIIAETCGLGDDQEFGIKNEDLVKRITRGLLQIGNLNHNLVETLFNG